MRRILTAFMLGICCLALLVLFVYNGQANRPTTIYNTEPAAESE